MIEFMSACHASVVLSASYLPAIFWFEIRAKKTLIRQLQASTVGLVIPYLGSGIY